MFLTYVAMCLRWMTTTFWILSTAPERDRVELCVGAPVARVGAQCNTAIALHMNYPLRKAAQSCKYQRTLGVSN